jgi:negative regulator of flagellin synthesis FlgM
MIMVIPPNNDITSNTQARHKAGINATASKATTAPVADSKPHENTTKDVQLSQEALTIKRLESKIHASDGIDTAKIDLIKQKIADGSYEINGKSIAEKLIMQDNN